MLGANLTLDRVVRLPGLVPGAVLRASSVDTALGGKPVNVARVALALGARVLLVANLPGVSGSAAAAQLEARGLVVLPVATGGELRVATIVLEAGGRTTVINEPGPVLDPPEAAALVEAFERAVAGERPQVVVLSGSLPPGAAEEMYSGGVRAAHRHGAIAVVDAGGRALASALAAGADLVKPNLAEAESLLRAGGTPAGSAELVDDSSSDVDLRCRAAARSLVDAGARAALVSGGRHGAALRAGGRDWWFAAPSTALPEVHSVGAGDALVGGLVAGLERGHPLVEAVRLGMAAAAISTTRPGPGDVAAEAVEAMLDHVPGATIASVSS